MAEISYASLIMLEISLALFALCFHFLIPTVDMKLIVVAVLAVIVVIGYWVGVFPIAGKFNPFSS